MIIDNGRNITYFAGSVGLHRLAVVFFSWKVLGYYLPQDVASRFFFRQTNLLTSLDIFPLRLIYCVACDFWMVLKFQDSRYGNCKPQRTNIIAANIAFRMICKQSARFTDLFTLHIFRGSYEPRDASWKWRLTLDFLANLQAWEIFFNEVSCGHACEDFWWDSTVFTECHKTVQSANFYSRRNI